MAWIALKIDCIIAGKQRYAGDVVSASDAEAVMLVDIRRAVFAAEPKPALTSLDIIAADIAAVRAAQAKLEADQKAW